MGGGSGLLMDDVSRVVLDRGGGFGFSLLLPPPMPPLMDSLVVEEVRQMPESSKELLQLPPRLRCCWKLLGGMGGGRMGSLILLTVIGGSELVRLPELSSLSLPLSLRFSSPEVF